MSTKRGRPTSPSEGAEKAVALIRALQNERQWTDRRLALAAGMQQSSVHRALGRKPPKLTPSLKQLCNYAENELSVDQPAFGVLARSRLGEEAVAAWDGTPEGLDKLLGILKLLGEYRALRERE